MIPNLDPQTVAIYFAGLIAVPILAALFRSGSLDLPTKLWTEFICSLILAYATLVFTGGLPLIPALPFGDPLAFFAALGEVFTKVFGLAVAVYLFLGQQLQAKAYIMRLNFNAKRLGAQWHPGDRPGYPKR